MMRETKPKLVRMLDNLPQATHNADNPLDTNMQAVAKQILLLMRLRLQEKGTAAPDALHYLGERLAVRYRKPGVKMQKIITAAIQSPPEVYRRVFPYLGLDITKPKTQAEGLLIRDLANARRGELSIDYIDARIDSFLFGDSQEDLAA